MPFPGRTYQIQNIESFDIYYIDCTKYLHTPYLILPLLYAPLLIPLVWNEERAASPKLEQLLVFVYLKLSQAVQRGECCREWSCSLSSSPSSSPPRQGSKLLIINTRCTGSVTFWSGSGSRLGFGLCYFRHWPSRRQQKTKFKKVFLIITFWRYIYIIFQR